MTTDTQLAVAPEPPKQIVSANERGLQFTSLNDMWRFCTAVVNSGTFKEITTPEVALIRLQAGLELGLTPIWSLTNIMVTNGKPSVWGDALLGLISGHPLCDDIIEDSSGEFPCDNYTARCTVKRKGRAPVVREFSVADAKRSGLWKDSPKVKKERRDGAGTYEVDAGPWYSYPKRMLQMRARSWACRDAFPDALRGIGVHEELDEIPQAKTPEKPAPAKIVFADETEVQK